MKLMYHDHTIQAVVDYHNTEEKKYHDSNYDDKYSGTNYRYDWFEWEDQYGLGHKRLLRVCRKNEEP